MPSLMATSLRRRTHSANQFLPLPISYGCVDGPRNCNMFKISGSGYGLISVTSNLQNGAISVLRNVSGAINLQTGQYFISGARNHQNGVIYGAINRQNGRQFLYEHHSKFT
jgi:hypothetical protein